MSRHCHHSLLDTRHWSLEPLWGKWLIYSAEELMVKWLPWSRLRFVINIDACPPPACSRVSVILTSMKNMCAKICKQNKGLTFPPFQIGVYNKKECQPFSLKLIWYEGTIMSNEVSIARYSWNIKWQSRETKPYKKSQLQEITIITRNGHTVRYSHSVRYTLAF